MVILTVHLKNIFLGVTLLSVAACASGGQSQNQNNQPRPAANFDIASQSIDSLYTLAQGFEGAGDLSQALNYYGYTTTKNPNFEGGWLGIIRILQKMGNVAGARSALDDALIRLPDSLELGLKAAEVAIMEGKPNQAIVRLVPSINAPDYRVPNLMGVASEMMGSHNLAKDYYGKALGYNPAAADVLSNLALSFAISGDQVTAVALMQDNLSRSDYRDIALEHLAVIYAVAGQVDAAMAIATDLLGTETAGENYGFYNALQYLPSSMKATAIFTKQITSEMQMIINREQQ